MASRRRRLIPVTTRSGRCGSSAGATRRGRRLLVAALSLACFGGAQDVPSPLVWTQSTFEDFQSGRFEDAGANAYVSRQGRVQLINKWDLNDDGFLDVVFANSHSQAEKLDATIYWGNGRDFDDRRT